MMELLKFNSLKVCPKCAAKFFIGKDPFENAVLMKYSTAPVASDGAGNFTSVRGHGDEEQQHLEKRCGTCNYAWLEETADAHGGNS